MGWVVLALIVLVLVQISSIIKLFKESDAEQERSKKYMENLRKSQNKEI